MKTTDLLMEKDDFCFLGPVKESKILDAEKRLGIKFSNEYIEIIKEYGVFSCSGHEFTGICKSKRLNVVDVTLAQRENNPNVTDLYVIELANIDDIVIWQSSEGVVYLTKGISKPVKICESIIEYLDK